MPIPGRSTFLLLGALALGACAPRGPAVVAPAADAEGLARRLESETALDQPIRVLFAWSLNEAGVRMHGEGVARVEPPYRARLDLFYNGETIVRAALVDGELRMPPEAPEDILPPPDLMWGVLGVFRPETGTELVGADELEDASVRLRYRYTDGRMLSYRVANGRIASMEILDGSHVVQRVEVSLQDGSRYPEEATYRNLADFRELKLTRESLEQVDPYPPGIWDPMSVGAGR